MIAFEQDELVIHFRKFDQQEYAVFLRAKALPESSVVFHDEDETYSIRAPARFASMLGVELPAAERKELDLSPFLFDDQAAIVRMFLDAKRFACWSDCGLGKTPIMLECARHVINRTGGRVLIITLNEIVKQTIQEAEKFYGNSLPVHRIKSREEMRKWCREGGNGSQLAITNYEKMNPESLADQVVTEMRHLAGIILDESNRLAQGGGKQKWALIKSCKGIEYKLSCTATPAPNDTMEFASQASFLEKMRSEGEIIWTYFIRDSKTHRWKVKENAREQFFRFMSSWSIFVRDPRRYGWRNGMAEVPTPEIILHEIPANTDQLEAASVYSVDRDGQRMLPGIDDQDRNTIRRAKLSQIAKGFVYRKGEGGKFDRIKSAKPPAVARIVAKEVSDGLQVLVWTVFDAENKIVAEELRRKDPRLKFETLTGKTKDFDRFEIMERFRSGECRVLISRTSMLGYGMNFQCCGSMVFSGFSDSYVSYYQAIRRAYRFGQTRSVRVHIPVVRDLEEDMLDNIFRKQGDHEAAILEMERNYIETLRGRQ